MNTLKFIWDLENDQPTLTTPDGSTEPLDLAQLWPNETSERQIIHNLQLAATICGIPDPTADTLRQLVNVTRGGFHTGTGRHFLGPVLPLPQGWTLTYGPTTDATVYGTTLTTDAWHNRYTTTPDILANAAGLLRLSNIPNTALKDAQDLLNASLFRAH
jgi:hypothetical protein